MSTTRAGRREAELAQIEGQLDTFALLRESGVVRRVSLNLEMVFRGRDMEAEETLELWGSIGTFLGRMHRSAKWWIADWLNFGYDRWSESDRYAQVMEATGLSLGYLQNVARVGRGIAPSRRLDGVAFSLHEEVYTLTPAEQTHWLREATQRDPHWTQRELRDHIKASTQQGVLPVEDGHENGGGGRRPNTTRVVEVAQLMHRQARVDGSTVIIPIETWRQLEAALGAGE